jgi:hypothetical protein
MLPLAVVSSHVKDSKIWEHDVSSVFVALFWMHFSFRGGEKNESETDFLLKSLSKWNVYFTKSNNSKVNYRDVTMYRCIDYNIRGTKVLRKK